MNRAVTALTVAALRVYRWVISPVFSMVAGPGSGCRFEPTCSRYAEEVFRVHGVCKGAAFTAARICRCHPWGGEGLDPAPPAPASASRRNV
jgi:putative membrane protein insertion efficiency factor